MHDLEMEQLLSALTQSQQQLAQGQQILMQQLAESQKHIVTLLQQTQEGAKGLIEEERKQLLLNALGDDEYQRLLSRLLPTKPYDLSFSDLVKQLKKQFHDNKSLFQRRFEALNFRATPPMAVIDILDRIRILGDAFEINNFNIDQLKILLTAISLSDHAYHTERALLFKITAEKENCTYSDIREICYAHVEHTADVRRVENQHSHEVNAVQKVAGTKGSNKEAKNHTKPTKKKLSSSQCRGCGLTTHKREDCPFKDADCRICKKTGHIAKVCLSKGASPKHRKYVEILLNGKKLKMQLDTGADVTTIGIKVWTKLGRPTLQPYKSSCVSVSGQRIKIEGFFHAT
ncbi:PREDICTED: uncharacterized protein K02A2.6-like [Cyphomyrmex costatus]|uniref:uncharacterized protein K02A2.6-like n=1 Tax=Cyphomyrmex costatus TaxID=456900 RepID=UPI0008523D0A|nr:PREDICTED: uncharacterized protein K02A2.6-like [Cyphomyrmex costatus]